MKNIYEYMQQTKEERQAHIGLNEKCIEIGGRSTQFKGLLAYHLGTTIPEGNDGRALLCHACYNGKCSNVRHLYWGTSKENIEDTKASGAYRSGYQALVEKYGKERVNDHLRHIAHKLGHIGGSAGRGRVHPVSTRAKISAALKGKPLSLERRHKISEGHKKRIQQQKEKSLKSKI